MKTKIFIFTISIFFFANLHAQQFISEGVIEYEVKANIQKTIGNNTFAEMLKENLPTFKTGYYTFTFSGNKSIYKFDHWDPKAKIPDFLRKSDEENVWFTDYNTGRLTMQKNMYGSNLVVDDSIRNLQWKLTNENRIIAGFNCRKAVTTIFDSVYLFAFYTDEITIPGGPCSISGLPGTILGVTIPRLYTSWIATKVMVNGVNVSSIKATTSKKPYNLKNLEAFLIDRTKDEYSDDEERNKDYKQQIARFIWATML